MAAGICARNIAIIVVAVSLVAGAWLYQAQRKLQSPVAPLATCAPLPANIVYVGPTQTIAEVERLSRAEMAAAPPSVPRVPFGHQNAEWSKLKALAQPGDTAHEFRTAVSGGHLILRGKCFVGQLAGWVR